MKMVMDPVRIAKNHMVVLSFSSAEDFKKIEERLRVLGTDLRFSTKARQKTIYCLLSLFGTHSKCHPMFEVSALSLLHRIRLCICEAPMAPYRDQSFLVHCSRCLDFEHGKRPCKDCPKNASVVAKAILARDVSFGVQERP
ncbi:hypothetical protein EVAR_5803_1 [Eumeta japonica]|uniref:Nucleic-acid-binding protein from transposon X-element n=1 Tax=Eumeta variegata TaxID=151549 RepID=A0A4C1T7C8_EUMVA|nr:hypothetical protein EVAR_5803_1 [Eumeta japonica]